MEGCHQTVPDGCANGAQEHKGGVVTDDGDGDTRDDGHDDNTDKHWKVHNARIDSAGALDGLEPNGKVVDGAEKGGTKAEAEDGCGPDGAFKEYLPRHRGRVSQLELDKEEEEDEKSEDDEQENNPPAVPGIRRPTPLQG